MFALAWLTLHVGTAAAQTDGGVAPDGSAGSDGGSADAGRAAPGEPAPPAEPPATAPAEEPTEPSPSPEPEGEQAPPSPMDALDLSLGDDEAGAGEGVPEDDPEAVEAGPGEDDFAEGTFELEGMVIEASPEDWFRTGGAITTIDDEFLDTFELDDPHTVMTQSPGVFVRGEDGYGLRPNIGIRGASAERSKKITLMEDGVLLAPAPYSAPAAYYFPIMTRMVEVEVIKGPSAIRYGPHTVGGAINMITRDVPRETGGAIDVAFGSNLYRKTHFHYGGRNEWGGLLFEGVYLGTQGFKDLDGGGNTGFDKLEGMLKAFAQTDPGERVYHRLDLKLGSSYELSNETYLGLTDADFEQTPYRRYAASQLARMEWWRTLVQVKHTLQVGPDFTLETTAYRNDYDRTWRKLNRFAGEQTDPSLSLVSILSQPTGQREVFYRILAGEENTQPSDSRTALLIGTNAREFVSQGIQSRATYRFETGDASHRIEGGLRLHYDRIDRDHTEEPFAMIDGTLVSQGADEFVLNNRDRATALAAHVMYGVTWHGLTLKPGLRTEVIWTDRLNQTTSESTDGTQVAVLPGLGAHYSLTDELGLLAGVHRGFSPAPPGGGDADPEFSVNYEAGARYFRPGSRSLLEVVGFVSDYDNLLAICTLSGGCPPDRLGEATNTGRVLVYGVEAVVAHEHEMSDVGLRFPLRLTYTYTGSRFQEDFFSSDPQYGQVSEGDDLPYVPNHQLVVRAGVAMDAWGVNLIGRYVGAMEEIASEVDPLLSDLDTDAYFMLDAEAHYRPTEAAKIYVQLRNVTATEPVLSHRPFGARPANPFLAQVGFEHAL